MEVQQGQLSLVNPEGSNLTFSYLSNYQDALSHRGFEYDWCVARGTMIVMADGSGKPVELVCVGDMVMTMLGPRHVHKPRLAVLNQYGGSGLEIQIL